MPHIRTRWLVIAAVVPLFLASVCVVVGLETGLEYSAFHVAGTLLALTGAGAICLLSIRFGQHALHFWREGKTARSGLWLVGGIVLLFFAMYVAAVTAIGALQHGQMRASAFTDRGEAWFLKGELDKAIADYTEAIRLDPQDAAAFHNRGLAWSNKQEHDQAIADFNEAIRLDPQLASAYGIRGTIWSKKGEHDKAIADFNEAIRLDPRLASAHNNRGITWSKQGEHDKAIADFNEAIELDPKNASAFHNRGNAWSNKQQHDQAIADYTAAIRLDPKDAAAYSNRGIEWGSKGEYDKAIADFNAAIQLDPQLSAFRNRRAWLESTCPDAKYRDGKKAVEDATRVCELDGWDHWNHVDTLAAAYAEAGDFPNAVKWEEKAIELTPEKEKAKRRSRLDLYKAGKPYRQEVKK
jgi:tetratricopeptide (TPR) repeat protein